MGAAMYHGFLQAYFGKIVDAQAVSGRVEWSKIDASDRLERLARLLEDVT
jgi:hypothetical protein